MELEHKHLLNATKYDRAVKAMIDSGGITGFTEAWEHMASRYPVLCELCGGLATVFPNTATVESDFSVLKWEKDTHRMALTDVSLEGILQAKQWAVLPGIAAELSVASGTPDAA